MTYIFKYNEVSVVFYSTDKTKKKKNLLTKTLRQVEYMAKMLLYLSMYNLYAERCIILKRARSGHRLTRYLFVPYEYSDVRIYMQNKIVFFDPTSSVRETARARKNVSHRPVL